MVPEGDVALVVRLTPAAPARVEVTPGCVDATGAIDESVVEITAVEEDPAWSC